MFNPLQNENDQQWKRRMEQHLMLLDVDVKRLWSAVPQTVDQIGNFPLNPAVFQPSSSGSSSSSSSGVGSSGSTSSSDPLEGCPEGTPAAIILTISDLTGVFAEWNGTHCLAFEGGCQTGVISYNSNDFRAFYDTIGGAKRWSIWLQGMLGDPAAASDLSGAGPGGVEVDWGGAIEIEYMQTGVTSVPPHGTITLSGSSEECPPPSSSSSGSSSSEPSSSSEESTSEASTSEESSSSGASSSEAPSSSEESSGASSDASSEESSSSASSEGPSSGESSSEGGGGTSSGSCPSAICSSWQYDAGEWNLVTFDTTDCETPECTSPLCSAPPPDPGYQGLFAYRYCDGTLSYGE